MARAESCWLAADVGAVLFQAERPGRIAPGLWECRPRPGRIVHPPSVVAMEPSETSTDQPLGDVQVAVRIHGDPMRTVEPSG